MTFLAQFRSSSSRFSFMSRDIALLTVILVEGYVVLASELLSMRLVVPFVGSDTAIISIIVSAVLMPLAFGYYMGGRFYQHRFKDSTAVQLRQVLVRNMVVSSVFLSLGLSHFCIEAFFAMLVYSGITSRFILTMIYSVTFLVVPVYLLGQTTPLISNYFAKRDLSKTTGKMLFCSTVGSFLGATFSTLVLMNTIGVHHTAALTVCMLTFLVLLMVRKVFSLSVLFMVCISMWTIYINSGYLFSKHGYVSNNSYSLIKVEDVEKEKEFHSRILNVNNSY